MLEHLKQDIDYGTPRREGAAELTLEIDGQQISVPAGTHTFTHGYSGDPADYSQYRMVIMGLYK